VYATGIPKQSDLSPFTEPALNPASTLRSILLQSRISKAIGPIPFLALRRFSSSITASWIKRTRSLRLRRHSYSVGNGRSGSSLRSGTPDRYILRPFSNGGSSSIGFGSLPRLRRTCSRADGVRPPKIPKLSSGWDIAQSRHSVRTGQGAVSRVPLQISIAVFIVLWSPLSPKNRLVSVPRQAASRIQSWSFIR